MIFIMMLKALPNKMRDMVGYLKKLKPPNGIKVQGVYTLLGEYDACIVFETSDSSKAMDFAVKVSCTAFCETETFMGTPIKDLTAEVEI